MRNTEMITFIPNPGYEDAATSITSNKTRNIYKESSSDKILRVPPVLLEPEDAVNETKNGRRGSQKASMLELILLCEVLA